MLAAKAPEQISIPKVPEKTIRELAKRIRPVMRFARVTPKLAKDDDVTLKLDRKGKLVLDDRGSFYYLKPIPLFTTAFTWPGTPKPDLRAPRLQKIRTITTYHTWAYYGFFKPTISEVLSQIPEDIIDQVIAFELEPPADPLEPWDIVQHGHHVAQTTFYGKRPRGAKAEDDEKRSGRVLSDPEPEGVAIVREVDGQLVLDDPMAMGMINAVGKHNCKGTFDMNADRVAHFTRRLAERNMSPADAVIVLLNVDDVHGGPLADALMPGMNWQEIRDRGEVPFARGLAMRYGIQEALATFATFDQDAATKLRDMTSGVAVVVVDHGVAEVFPAE
jgi:hypothetical protein